MLSYYCHLILQSLRLTSLCLSVVVVVIAVAFIIVVLFVDEGNGGGGSGVVCSSSSSNIMLQERKCIDLAGTLGGVRWQAHHVDTGTTISSRVPVKGR